ncbi:prostaglandin E receptor 1c (subtype EP1) [Nothobranchius furzeri]|nr:prostaglandin E receptor 1c (subtype EP1) [Nothobranchius furzeri]
MTPAPLISLVTSPGTNYSNSSTISPPIPLLSGLLMSCLTMIFGTISNLTALGILTKTRARFRGQSKATFLLLTVALLLADLGGHLILGAFALYGHINRGYKMVELKSNGNFCNVFGASMVFFGLCPLVLGCAMAVERWVAINRPFLHLSFKVAHAWQVVLLLTTSALVLALLPIFNIGNYITQPPYTWCFLPIQDSQSTVDKYLVLVFLSLGLTALIISLLCNILSGIPLVKARMKSRNCYRRPSAHGVHHVQSSSMFCSLDVEMLVQLAAVTVVSCVCWGPFFINILMKQLTWGPNNQEKGFTLQSVRMASWNQILDPWVYI